MMVQYIDKNFFTQKELANFLQISPRTLSRWARERKGPPRAKVNHFICYTKSGVEDWIKSNETQPLSGGAK